MSEPSSSDTSVDIETSSYITTKSSPLHRIRTICSAFLLVVWCLVMLSTYFFWRVLGLPNLSKSYLIFHRGCCWLFGMRCRYEGEMSTFKPTLYLSNHVSYLDVFVLGSTLPAYFIAKSEVANWPVLGSLAKVQNTLFFERNSKKVRGQLGVMSEHFNQKGSLILFPEGTSTNGEYVKAFKTSLLQSVENAKVDVMIQPVTVTYTRYRGKMMDRAARDQFAWYDTMPFASHFFHALGLASSEVVVTYHSPVSLSDFEDRKACALHCQAQVASGLSRALEQID